MRKTLTLCLLPALPAVLVATIFVAHLGGGDPATEASTPRPTTSAPTVVPPSTTSPTTAPPTTLPVTPAPPNAEEALAPFFSAVTTLDSQLSDAATAINGSGPPWTTIDSHAAAAVQAAALEPVAEAIPAGLPPDLLQSVVLVYSDLSSRRHAMTGFAYANGGPVYDDLLRELRNGSVAAARFDDDLAAARSQAALTPAFTVRSPDSRQAAEVLLVVGFVEEANGGCDSRGGTVLTRLPTIDWPSTTLTAVGIDGSTVDLRFNAELGPDGTWDVGFNAC